MSWQCELEGYVKATIFLLSKNPSKMHFPSQNSTPSPHVTSEVVSFAPLQLLLEINIYHKLFFLFCPPPPLPRHAWLHCGLQLSKVFYTQDSPVSSLLFLDFLCPLCALSQTAPPEFSPLFLYVLLQRLLKKPTFDWSSGLISSS